MANGKDRDETRSGDGDETAARQPSPANPSTPGDMPPSDTRGRSEPKTDGNPNVTGDVRSS